MKEVAAAMASSLPLPHIVLFPFMSKGHSIPLIHLAHLLSKRGVQVTIFTTPSNSPFFCRSLGTTPATVISLPFLHDAPNILAGIESTENLPSLSLFPTFVESTKFIQPHFETALRALPGVNCIVSDGFLWWTQESAASLGIPRLAFYGMNNYAPLMCRVVMQNGLIAASQGSDEPFSVPCFPWVRLERADLQPPFNDPSPSGPSWDFVVKTGEATAASKGILVNSFYELELRYVDYWNKELGPKVWCVGPLCLADPPQTSRENLTMSRVMDWLDEQASSVLYIAFGSQVEVSLDQLHEIASGLERSKVGFLWILRNHSQELTQFEKRVENRGLVVRDWVEQQEILQHKNVGGFLSHCGWNSILDSLCARVPILAWPMIADQFLNAKFIVEELGIGLRLSTYGSIVKSEIVEENVKELMEGEKGRATRDKVKELGEAARKATEVGGSSHYTLELLLDNICRWYEEEKDMVTNKVT